ncbi:AraC family transcriptional regulator [Mahella australiensis]|uniref:Transcriptional regulator, AraC family n=1 Tax=Mahella australiensis (strain DSM 15567 / CIP 107919 / 50-1 BON) TaxID=697281 RepID=F3ZY19_MAHA5|nr:AraC family transcriptional regulator [Mahella australiensis]AEE97715.1 transcriptional regulator, AraC family [Mahella australiensis 50-1 BON]
MGRAYYRLFVSFLVVIIIPVMIFGIFAYNRSLSSIEEEAVKNNQTLLNVFKQNIDGILMDIDTSFIQNGLVIETFDGINLPESYGDYLSQRKLMNINDFVTHLNTNSDVVDDAMIYYKQAGVFVTPNGRFSEEGFKDEPIARHLKGVNDNVLWLGPRQVKSTRSGGTIPVMSYVRQLPVLPSYKRAAFVVNINLHSLSSVMASYSSGYERQKIYLLDSEGIVIADADKEFIGKDLSIYPYISQVLNNKQGYEFRDDINGQASLVSFLPSSVQNWKYVVITPMQSLMAGSTAIQRGIIAMSIFLILVGIAASVLISRRLYRPVKSIVSSWQGIRAIDSHSDEYSAIGNYLSELQQRNNDLEQQWKNVWPVVKEKMLLDILKGKNTMITDINNSLRSYGIKADFSNFVVMAIEIDDIECMEDIDKELAVFSVKNAVNEIIKAEYDGFVTSEDYTVLSVVNLPQAEYYLDYKRTLGYLCTEIMDSIEKHIKLTISIGISRLYHDSNDLHKAYSEAVEAIKYRLLYGNRSLTFIEDAEPGSDNMSTYPYDKEQELVKYIKAMDVDKANMALKDITSHLATYKSYEYIKQFFIQLIGYIMVSVYDMGYTETEIFGARSLLKEINSIKTLKDATQWLSEICNAVINFLAEKHKGRNRNIVAQCKAYVDEHFEDSQLSLLAVAEELYTSESYLSRIFKEETGMTFTEYIAIKRIERAKYFLENTDMTMEQIAKNIGLSIQSFMRIFKKYESMSPGQFRASKRV